MSSVRRPAWLLSALLLPGCASSTSVPAAAVAEQAAVAPSPSPSASPRARPNARPSASASPSPVVVGRGTGELEVVPGGSATAGTGPLTTYVVEVEGGLGVDPVAFARAVDTTLADPRSWTSGARRSLRRVDGPADMRVALASPATVDRLCAPLRTVGRYSCANGDRAVLNVARWLTGVPAYDGLLPDYRAYLVNHEVGHALGFGHVPCPGAGQVAPVMLQQSFGLDGCERGPWPSP